MNKIELEKNKFGMLTILDKKRENRRTYYYCRCDCGREKWIRADSVNSGAQKSCGCLSKETQIKRKDITGIKYNSLTAIKFTGKGKGKEEIWLCKCDCGNEIEVKKNNLYTKNKDSCGCLAKKQRLEAVKKANEEVAKKYLVEGTSIAQISRETLIKSNKSGVTGVTWDSSRQKWIAQIIFKNKRYFLGRYENKEDAIKARKEAEERYFNNFLESIK